MSGRTFGVNESNLENCTQGPGCFVCNTVPNTRLNSRQTTQPSPLNFGNISHDIPTSSNHLFERATPYSTSWRPSSSQQQQQQAGIYSSTMTSMPKLQRRRARGSQRTPSPVAFIDLTTDTPPPPRPIDYRRPVVGSPIRPEDTFEDLFPNYPRLDYSPIDDFSRYLDDSSLLEPQPLQGMNNVVSSLNPGPPSPKNNVPAINDSVDGEPVLLSCPICFENLRPALKPTSTKCGHLYCESCLDAIIKTHKKCSKCNASINRKSCIRLFL